MKKRTLAALALLSVFLVLLVGYLCMKENAGANWYAGGAGSIMHYASGRVDKIDLGESRIELEVLESDPYTARQDSLVLSIGDFCQRACERLECGDEVRVGYLLMRSPGLDGALYSVETI